MPQMFPLLWSFLSLACITALLATSSIIHQSFTPATANPKVSQTPPSTHWKW